VNLQAGKKIMTGELLSNLFLRNKALHLFLMSENNKFSINIKVKPEHLDAVQHVNNVIYVQWMQDAASLHWQSLAPVSLQEAVFWVVKRHEVDYYNQAFLDDDLQISTWTGEHTNVTWKRYYEVIRPSDGKKIISAVSTWILLDSKTQRPRKIDEEMIKLHG
jgi:acyl-CoA thioester hydrolase